MLSRAASPEFRARVFWHTALALANLALIAGAASFLLGFLCGLYDQGIL